MYNLMPSGRRDCAAAVSVAASVSCGFDEKNLSVNLRTQHKSRVHENRINHIAYDLYN